MRLPGLDSKQARNVTAAVAALVFVGLVALAARTWGIAPVVAIQTGFCVLVLWIANNAYNRADDALETADQALGPISPEYNGEGPWNDAQPVDLNKLTAPVEWPHGSTRMIDAPRPSPVPRPKPETYEQWQARTDAEYQQALARINGGQA